jgi:hypothetical protein
MDMWHEWEQMHTEISWENLKEPDRFGDLTVDGRIILNWILKKYVGRCWSGFTWLKIKTSGVFL